MSNIILSSTNKFTLPAIARILKKRPEEISLLYVITAGKLQHDSSVKYQRQVQVYGYKTNIFDIEGKNEQEIRTALVGCDAVFVGGGNTFYLLKAIHESGFQAAVKDYIKQGTLYVGTSAGAYVACPTIEMSTWEKPGEEKLRYGLTDLTAMNLVPFLVVCHYTSDIEAETRAGISKISLPVRLMTDDQGLFVHDGIVEFFGDGEEVRL